MIKSINSIMYNLSLLNERYSKVNTASTTGEALEYGSDDSVRYGYILKLQSDIKSYESIKTNIQNSAIFNETSDDALNSAKKVLESIIAKLIAANTDTVNQSDKKRYAQELEGYKKTLLSIANTKINGKYIFSGTKIRTPPFTEKKGVISYQGNNLIRTINTEADVYSKQNVSGAGAFYYKSQSISANSNFTFGENNLILDENNDQWKLINKGSGSYELSSVSSSLAISVTKNINGTYTTMNNNKNFELRHSIFDDLNKVIAALKLKDTSGNTVAKSNADKIISDILDKMQNSIYDTINTMQAREKSRTAMIAMYSDIVSSKLTNLKTLEKEYASADIAELAIKSQSLKNTYEALYLTISRVNKLSLVNYL